MSAAVGLAVAIAFLRGITRREVNTIGNFWVDLVRGLLWVLLPLCLAGSVFLVSQGVVQNLRPYDRLAPLDSAGQTIAQGPVASQEAIKMIGTNGGGFFNANSAHPFENPTPLSNLFALLAIFAIPSALTHVLGTMSGSRAHGWAVWAAMVCLFLAGVTATYWAEARGNPLLAAAGADQAATETSPGGNMEGKEVRFGIAGSALFATVTTDASCGAVNSMHESFTPIGGMVPLVNIMLGEVVFGGVGAGLYGMLVFVILSVFIAGLMVGRTPEYLGKTIQAYEVQMAVLAVLVFPLTVLLLTGISVVSPGFGLSSLLNRGPHGLTEVLYAFTSAAGNNGSAFAGLNANTLWYNTTIGLATIVGRFFVIVPTLAIAGSLGKKKRAPASRGHVPRDHAALRQPPGRRDRPRRGAHVSSGAQPGADRRAPADGAGTGVLMTQHSAKPIWDRAIVAGALKAAVVKLQSARDGRKPGDVRRGGRQRPGDRRPGARRGARPPGAGLRVPGHGVALAHGPLRQLRRSHGRRARQGAGGHAPPRPHRRAGTRGSATTAPSSWWPRRACESTTSVSSRRAS